MDIRVTGAEVVAQLTGPGSVNDTARRWDVHGTDLGHTFLHRGALWMVFGDTFGARRRHWRSNAMARVADPDPRHGLRFERMVSDATGRARELLGSRKVDHDEQTVIPTYGVSLGERMVLHYMSVRHFGRPGTWEVNHSGLAWSDDDGERWTVEPAARWPGTSNFAQVAFVADGDDICALGIPAGRFGGAQLARVPAAALLDVGAWRYWDGQGWSADRARAATLVPAPVGELSLRWNRWCGRWLLLTLDERRAAVVLRSAAALTGPWSDPQAVLSAREHPQLYAPYLTPLPDDEPEVWFTLSLFGPYNVFLARAALAA
ncbi:MAG TPA: DUF4185 domain-containing protein [Egibacteraceae bacterium]|nr:DUF4185 domain-containing protein [Egibacteraceae bacterium]